MSEFTYRLLLFTVTQYCYFSPFLNMSGYWNSKFVRPKNFVFSTLYWNFIVTPCSFRGWNIWPRYCTPFTLFCNSSGYFPMVPTQKLFDSLKCLSFLYSVYKSLLKFLYPVKPSTFLSSRFSVVPSQAKRNPVQLFAVSLRLVNKFGGLYSFRCIFEHKKVK